MKIAFLGDIAFLGQFDKKKNKDVEDKLLYLKNELAKYDYVVANLESPLTSKNTTMVCKSMHLKADPCNVDLLKYLNVSAVSLANNHIADYGMAGLYEAERILDKAGIGWFGVQNKSLEVDIKGEKICLSGFCCYSSNGTHYEKDGINLLTRDNLEKQMEQDERKGVFTVMSLHWGLEHTNYPAYEHVCLMNSLLQKHKAVVCGHHPHIVQGVQKISESLVAYSVGNAIFDTCISRNGKLEVALNEGNRKCFCLGVTIEDNEIREYSVNGFYIGSTGIEAYDIEDEIREISEKLDIKDTAQYEKLRREQFQNVIESKFGKHDLKWVMSRMNYYAVGAKVSGILRAKKYKKEVERFING